MSVLFAAVDCGTTAVKSGIFDAKGRLLGLASRQVPCVHGADGSIVQDAEALRRAAFAALRQAVLRARIRPSRIASLCITNQRATLIAAGDDGIPAGPAVSWQDMRGERAMQRLCATLGCGRFTRITGLPESAIFSIGKLPAARRAPRRGRFLLVQDYLLRAFGAADFVCDRSNASLTGLLDTRTGEWSEELLDAAGVKQAQWSQLVPSGARVGAVSRDAAARCGLPAGVALVSGAGDQQCAGIGAGVVEPGTGAVTLGTAGVVMAYSARAVNPTGGLMCTLHGIPGAWCLEGLQPSAMGSVLWALALHRRKRLDAAMQARMDAVAPGADGVLFWPYLVGAGAPHWSADARTAWFGMAAHHGEAALMRAVLEGVAFENKAMLEALERHGAAVRRLVVNGGGSTIELWNRIQASVYGLPLRTLCDPQATLLGAAVLGAVGAGAAGSVRDACAKMVRLDCEFPPDPEWRTAYKRIFARHRKIGEQIRVC